MKTTLINNGHWLKIYKMMASKVRNNPKQYLLIDGLSICNTFSITEEFKSRNAKLFQFLIPLTCVIGLD